MILTIRGPELQSLLKSFVRETVTGLVPTEDKVDFFFDIQDNGPMDVWVEITVEEV